MANPLSRPYRIAARILAASPGFSANLRASLRGDFPARFSETEPALPVATENRIRAGAAAAMGYSHRRDDRPPEAARRIARRKVQIACGSRSRDGISPVPTDYAVRT